MPKPRGLVIPCQLLFFYVVPKLCYDHVHVFTIAKRFFSVKKPGRFKCYIVR